MTLGRQLAYAISAIFLVALVGIESIYLRSAQAHLQQQIESLAQDAATSLGLSLGALLREGDTALAETIINPAFDRGHYERIDYDSATGERVVSKRLSPEEGRYPRWFVKLFPMQEPTAESLVSAGWRQLGKVRVTVHPRFAYEQLWATARDTVVYLLLIYAAALLALQLFLRGVLRPLAAIEAAAQAISSRNFVTLKLRPSTRELGRVVEAMNSLSGKVREAVESETRRAEKLQAAAYRDPVTGLMNGRGFAARFESIYEGEHEPFIGVLALVELADLGTINRELGPERCDDLLRGMYRQMEEVAKASGGFAGRWTGALTIMTLPQLHSDAARERLAALRSRAGLALKEFGLDRADRIYCAGVDAKAGPATLRALARGAEEAVLQARESADGIVVLSASSPADAATADTDPLASVRDALAARRLQLVGQVVYRMSDHRALHTEILSRLRDAAGNEMAAAQFMPIVAAHGLGEQLDMSVIERVIEAARGRGDSIISINVSMRSVERAEFLDWLAKLLERERAIAGRLVFEMAEHGVLKNEAAAAALARLVKRCGAGFAIDNFGVHRDSLALVQRLRPVYIKLAAAHTPRMVTDAGTRFFAESLVRAAGQLDIPVIAQNVEDDATFQALGAIGFAGYQGNLIGRPAPWPRR
jgi:EAL domain-containing protein (putative c-di-GMP-specific phosphodiesterase class I)/GGDEF domain-containing protein